VCFMIIETNYTHINNFITFAFVDHESYYHLILYHDGTLVYHGFFNENVKEEL
jgi:hypothetical protein